MNTLSITLVAAMLFTTCSTYATRPRAKKHKRHYKSEVTVVKPTPTPNAVQAWADKH